MATTLFLGGKLQLFDDNGDPLAGGKVYFYEPGGSSTPKNTYQDEGLSTANTNPVVLDAAGRASVWLDGDYTVRVEDSAGNLIYTTDNVNPGGATSASTGNLVANGSFEGNALGDGKTPDGWTLTEYTGATVVLDSSDQRAGARSIKFTSAGNGGGVIVTEAYIETSPGRSYEVSWLMRSSVADVRNLVELVWYDAGKSELSTTTLYDDSTTNPTSWTLKKAAAEAPSGVRYARLRMYGCHSSDTTVGSTWYDDVWMREARHEMVSGNALTPHENLRVTRPTTSTVRVQADAVLLRDANGVYRRFAPVDVTVDLTLSGAGGLDTGAEQASTWYRVWLIGKADGTLSGVFSTSQTAPTLPSGYTYYGKVAVARNNASSDLWRMWQHGNHVAVSDEAPSGSAVALTPINASTNVFPTNLAIASWAPDEAWVTRWRIYATASALVATSNNGSPSLIAGDFVYAASGDNTVGEVIVNESRNVQYGVVSAGSGDMTANLLGWRYS